MRKKRLQKICCEICGENNKSVLHKHHIIEKTEVGSNDTDNNLAIICSNCHNRHHFGDIEILGVLPSTKLPYGRTLIYKISGKINIEGAEEFLIKPEAPQMKVKL